MAKKHLNATILKSNLSKLWRFQISQNFWIETVTQKSTKFHVQPGNHCSLIKNLQPIHVQYIDHIRCNALLKVGYHGKKSISMFNFKVKFKQTLVFLDFLKLLLDGN